MECNRKADMEKIKTTEFEVRSFVNEIRALPQQDDGKRALEGYAIKWEQLSSIIWGMFQEKFAARSFTNIGSGDGQYACLNHNLDVIVGSTFGSTLQLTQDDTGLRFRNDLPDNAQGQYIYDAVNRRDMRGMSVRFRATKELWDESNPDVIIRTVIEAELLEISYTAFPAYPQTEVQEARSAIQAAYEKFKEERTAAVPTLTTPVDEVEVEVLKPSEEQRAWLARVKNKLTIE